MAIYPFEKHYVRRYFDPLQILGLDLHFMDFHHLVAHERFDYPEHTHREYELVLVEKGPYVCILNHCEVEVPSGQFLVIKPGDSHSDRLKPGMSHYVLHFSLTPDLFRKDVLAVDQQSRNDFFQGLSFFSELEMELQESDSFSSRLQDSLLEVFFWRMVRKLPEKSISASLVSQSEKQRFVHSLYGTFETLHRENAGLKELAAALEISPRTLCYRCKHYLKSSPVRLFLEFRIGKASDLLLYSSLTVQEVAFALGFSNAFNFSRAFKAVMGGSPSEYRKNRANFKTLEF